jgi:hypothetical protein
MGSPSGAALRARVGARAAVLDAEQQLERAGRLGDVAGRLRLVLAPSSTMACTKARPSVWFAISATFTSLRIWFSLVSTFAALSCT